MTRPRLRCANANQKGTPAIGTIDRYLLREIAVPFAVGLGLFFVVVSFGQVLKVSDAVTGLGVGGADILQALAYSFPPLMGLLIPVATLFATLLAVGRLAADREIVAMAAAGISPYRLLRIPALVGALLAVVCMYTLIEGEPWGIRGIKGLMARSAQRTLASGVRVGQFNQWMRGVTFLARGKQGDMLTDVVFADRRNPRVPLVISARRGQVQGGARARDIEFELYDGSMLLYDKNSDSQRWIKFESSTYHLDVGKLVKNKLRTANYAQGLDIFKLWDKAHNPKVRAKRRALYTVTFHRKMALPIATIIFALLAVPLAAARASGGRARGFLYSTGIVGAYYYAGRAVELSARSGTFPAEWAAWVPNMLGLVALAYLLWRMRAGRGVA